MRYPSELLREAADKVDEAEDWIMARDWRFWRWAEATKLAEMCKAQRNAVLNDYRELYAFAQMNHVHGDSPEPPQPAATTKRLLELQKAAFAMREFRRKYTSIVQ